MRPPLSLPSLVPERVAHQRVSEETRSRSAWMASRLPRRLAVSVTRLGCLAEPPVRRSCHRWPAAVSQVLPRDRRGVWCFSSISRRYGPGILRVHANRLFDTEADGSRSTGLAHAPLQPAHGRGLHGMDPPIHSVSQEEASAGDGGRGGFSVSCGLGRAAARQCVDAESGVERAAVPVSRGAARGPAQDRGCRARQDAKRLPVVLSRDEVRAVLRQLEGTMRLIARCCTARACGLASVWNCG